MANDELGKKITRVEFLNELISGKYLPLRLKSKKDLIYRLYNPGVFQDQEIKETIINEAENYKRHFLWEEKQLPDFNFTDLNGKNYTSQNTKQNILILKCWFIHCTRCILEMPELNTLANKYKNRRDILFVSLASDKPEDLQSFLKKQRFYYAVVPNMDDYMTNKLKITSYPTHIIVGKNGLISKLVNNVEDLEYALNIEMKK